MVLMSSRDNCEVSVCSFHQDLDGCAVLEERDACSSPARKQHCPVCRKCGAVVSGLKTCRGCFCPVAVEPLESDDDGSHCSDMSSAGKEPTSASESSLHPGLMEDDNTFNSTSSEEDRHDSNRKTSTSGRTLRIEVTDYAVVQPGEVFESGITKVPQRPMMELEAGSNVWYQAYVIKETANEVRVRFPATTEDDERKEWVAKSSSRIWRGSYKSRNWKWLGGGAWAPKQGRKLNACHSWRDEDKFHSAECRSEPGWNPSEALTSCTVEDTHVPSPAEEEVMSPSNKKPKAVETCNHSHVTIIKEELDQTSTKSSPSKVKPPRMTSGSSVASDGVLISRPPLDMVYDPLAKWFEVHFLYLQAAGIMGSSIPSGTAESGVLPAGYVWDGLTQQVLEVQISGTVSDTRQSHKSVHQGQPCLEVESMPAERRAAKSDHERHDGGIMGSSSGNHDPECVQCKSEPHHQDSNDSDDNSGYCIKKEHQEQQSPPQAVPVPGLCGYDSMGESQVHDVLGKHGDDAGNAWPVKRSVEAAGQQDFLPPQRNVKKTRKRAVIVSDDEDDSGSEGRPDSVGGAVGAFAVARGALSGAVEQQAAKPVQDRQQDVPGEGASGWNRVAGKEGSSGAAAAVKGPAGPVVKKSKLAKCSTAVLTPTDLDFELDFGRKPGSRK